MKGYMKQDMSMGGAHHPAGVEHIDSSEWSTPPHRSGAHCFFLRVAMLVLMFTGGMVSEAWAATYNYILLGKPNGESHYVKTLATTNTAFGLPTEMKSGFVTSYHYYHEDNVTDDGSGNYTITDASTEINDISTTADGGTIYVTYEYDHRLFDDGSGTNTFHIALCEHDNNAGNNMLFAKTNGIFANPLDDGNVVGDGAHPELWTVTGDPYCLKIHPADQPGWVFYRPTSGNPGVAATAPSGAYNTFMLLGDATNSYLNAVSDGSWIAASGFDWGGGNYTLTSNGDSKYNEVKKRIHFEKPYNLKVLNSSGKVVAETSLGYGGLLPTYLRVPIKVSVDGNRNKTLLTRYHYYSSATANGDGTYSVSSSDLLFSENNDLGTLPTSYYDRLAGSILSLGSGPSTLYVRYEYDSSFFGGVYTIQSTNQNNNMQTPWWDTSDKLRYESGTQTSAVQHPTYWRPVGDPYEFQIQSAEDATRRWVMSTTTFATSTPVKVSSDPLADGESDTFMWTYSRRGTGDNVSLALNTTGNASIPPMQRIIVSHDKVFYSWKYNFKKPDASARLNTRFNSVAGTTVKYRIINKQNKQVWGDIIGSYVLEPQLPVAYQSPLATNYRYYTTASENDGIFTIDTSSEIVPSTFTPVANQVIYVTYDYNPSNSVIFGTNAPINIDLTGATGYAFNVNNLSTKRYMSINTSEKSDANAKNSDGSDCSNKRYYEWSRGDAVLPDPVTQNYLWSFGSSNGIPDPYAIVVRSANPMYANYFLTSGGNGKTMKNGAGNGTHLWLWPEAYSDVKCVKTWALLTGNKFISELEPESSTNYYYINDGGTPWVRSAAIASLQNNAAPEILLEQVGQVSYHVVNKSNAIAISKTITPASGSITMPDDLKTPYITDNDNYKFFSTQADAYAYTNTGVANNEISGAVHEGQVIYVGYNYDPSERPSTLPILDGALWYQMIDRYNNQDNYLYSQWNSTAGNSSVYNSASAQTGAFTDDYHLWKFTGNDPYCIYVSNKWINDVKINDGNDYNLTYASIRDSWYRQINYGTTGNAPMVLLAYDETYYNLAFISDAANLGNYNYLFFFGANGTNASNNVWFMRNNSSSSPLYKSDRVGCRLSFHSVSMGTFRFHLTTHVSGSELTSDATADYSSTSSIISLPTALERKFTTPTFYTSYNSGTGEFSGLVTDYFNAHNGAFTTTEDGETIYHLYVKYDVTSLPFTVSTDYEHATWYRTYNNDNHYAYYSGSQVTNGSDSYSVEYQFAFIGDPYEMKIINRQAGADKYLGVAAGSSSGTIANFIVDSGDPIITWELVDNGFAADEFALRQYGTASSPMYCAYSGGTTPLRLISTTTRIKAVALPDFTYTYNIVDNTGRIAIKYTLKSDEKLKPTTSLVNNYTAIPAAIRSPYLAGETMTFYATATQRVDGESNPVTDADGRAVYDLTDPITETPATDGANIYVRYTNSALLAKPLHLRGVRGFDIKVNGDLYLYDNGSGTLTHDASTTSLNDRHHLWYFKGLDPYAVEVQNIGGEQYLQHSESPSAALSYGTAATGRYFILMQYADHDDSPTNEVIRVELMAATGGDIGGTTPANYYSVGASGGTPNLYANVTGYEHGDAPLKLLLTVGHVEVVYDIVDKQGKIVVAGIANESPTTPLLPDAWQSPLVKQYHYWNSSNFNISGTTYTLKGDQTEISGIAEAANGHVYVTYDVKTSTDDGYIDLNPAVTDYTERVSRSSTDNTQVRDAGKFGTMYMLQFLNGVPDYLENGGDEVETFTTKPVFPYTNGDGQMYIYGQTRWDTQSTAGASTRTRWPWYLLSINNDPYHVMVTSWQNTHAQSGTNYYGFLRTYYESSIGQVITTTVSDDPRVTTDATHGDPAAVPTQYMLLGTKDAYKLVTSDGITSATADATYGQHQTVKSFEQYWKTYETVTDENKYTLPDMNPGLSHAQDAGTLHSYGAWVNARPDIGGGARSFEYRDHWYQTISMGDGTFKLNATEIDAVLVLMDNHGWEVMRHPIAKTSETAKKAAYQQALRKYDSPMVARYKFYGTRNVTHKVAGYHKYNIDDTWTGDATVLKASDLAGTATSLADYPEKYSGGALYDLYVTYDVKPAYADAYQVADGPTEGTARYPFLIRQDGLLAKAANATTLSTIPVSSTGLDSNTATGLDDDALYWYLKPNFNIDDEMGYRYSDEYVGVTNNEKTRAQVNQSNHEKGLNGFDPYNIQIYNKQHPSAYLTTNATAAAIENHQHMVTTAPAGNGALTLGGTPAEKFTATVPDYDSKTLHITNATFMAVQDENGNMRLMPRFDHSHVVTNLATLEAQGAAQPMEDKAYSQTTLLLRPEIYHYIIVDNQGHEALHYALFSSGQPEMPAKFTSPLATGFKFYKNLTATAGVYPVSGIDANEITGSFHKAGSITDNTVYVRYSYNPTADTDGLLKGTWYHAELTDNDVKVTTGGITKETFTNDAAHRWRFMESAASDADPYGVTLWNGSSETESSGNRYIILKPSTGVYALMRAGNSSTTEYAFLDGSGTPAITAQADYVTLGTIASSKHLTLTPVLTTNTITYKLITHTGQVALTGEDTYTEAEMKEDDFKFSLPEWMRSPLMKNAADTYSYYAAITGGTADAFTQGPKATTYNLNSDGVVYVRYDYEKSRIAFTDFKFMTNYLTDAPIDLSGQVPYVISIGGNHNLRQVEISGDNANTVTLQSNGDNLYNEAMRMKGATSWLLCGDDPYEVSFVNPAYSTTKVLAAQTPAGVVTNDGQNGVTMYMAEPDDATYPHKTFMILKAKDDGVNFAGQMGLKLYVTGHDDLFISENGKMSLWKDEQSYQQRRASTSEPGNRQYYSRVCFRPNVVYHVITNKGKEAVHAYSVRGSDYDSKNTIVIPEYIQTPLLDKKNFVYYTERPTWDAVAERLVTDETSRLDATKLSMADVVTQHMGHIYVRYTYSREDSPLTFPDGIGATTRQGLDLSGNTWYNLATRTLSENNGLGSQFVYYNKLAYMKTETQMDHSSQFETLTDYGNGTPGLSDKRMLWRFVGDDPYAIRIYNGSMSGKYLSGTREADAFSFADENSDADIESFFLLRAKGQDDRMIRDDQAGISFFISGQDFETRQTQSFINVLSKKMNYYSNDAILKSSYSNTWQCYLLTSGSGGTSGGWVSFYKAPVARKYRYHAIKYDGTKKVGETWNAVLMHDWLTPVVIEDDIARLYSKYETKSEDVSGDKVIGTNVFNTRSVLNDVAQFYSDQEMTTRIFDNSDGVKTYDVYPVPSSDQDEENVVCDIYFKYQVDTEKLAAAKITSAEDDIAQDVQTYRGDDEQKGQGRLTKDTMRANWFFMVLDTDGDATKDVGKRMFLRREDDGSVGWMDNDYALHKDKAENYNSWTYHRLAEWYKAGDNDGFREGRWLWTFVGDDPYNIRLLNMESAVGVDAEGEGVYTLNGAEDCWTVASTQETTTTKNNVTTTTTTYPVSIPTEKPTENDTWGLCNGYGSEGTISLQLPFTNETNHTTLYWQMADRVVGGRRANDRSNALLLLPYEPVVYEDVNLVIRRSDEVEQYKKNEIGLTDMTTGISKLYFAASERMFESGDKIDMSDEKSLPLNVRRAFCNYTLYSDVFKTVGGEYTITEGPYPTTVQATTAGTWSGTGADAEYKQKGDLLYDEDGKPVWTYRNADGTPAPGGAQSIYASYEVTSDVFLKSAPTEKEMKSMAEKNDHVYFMDFPDANETNPHHAYFEPQETFKSQTGDVTTKKVDGIYRTEKKKWDGTKFVDDTDQIYNHSHFKTTDNRMTSVPERLKWYFVGDPYKVQVYCTAGAWGSNNASSNPQTVAANLCRFDPTETNFQFVVDCVHLRVPDYSNIDNRDTLIPTDEDDNLLTEEAFHNRHYNQPYFHDFYWECVPAVSDDENAFALRFKEDNDLLGYRNVYYYLAHDGLNKQYRSGGDNVTYKINLSYNPNNERHQTGTYAGYHAANDQNTVIKLVQPAKVYVTVNRKADGENRYDDKSKVVEDELSEYYGLGETITEVPRHLQRKFVQYENLTNTKTGVADSSHVLTTANATSIQTCSAHSSNVHVTGTQIDPVFKFSVDYTVADLSNENNGAHYFTPSMGSTMQWLDMTVGNSNWLYYDKTNKTDGNENTALVSNYRSVVENNAANGWEDGLKGLHWAFVGDPYDFTIVNRRRYEDGGGSGNQWLVGTKTTIGTDSIIWPTHLASSSSVAGSSEKSTFASSSEEVTHWSLQMWKVAPQSGGGYQSGNSDGNYFLRTSSLKADENDVINGSSGNQTSNYWRMVRANYTSSTPASYFEAVPFSLSDLATYNNDKYSANYSASMNGLGITQQLLEIRTAVAKDEDNANNDCFDANIYIYNKTTGELKVQLKHIELKYADIDTALPQTLRRYGCKYPEAYQIEAVEGDRKLFSHLSTSGQIAEFSTEVLSADKAIMEDGKKYIEIAYLYTVTDDVAQFFTTQDEANKDEYLWANAYYKWNQTYSGTNQRIVYYEQEFDHYVYNAQGQIIDEVYKTVEKVRYETGTTTTPAYGWVNSHTDTEEAYGNVRLQSDDDALKWALVGDPYDFTLKNYAKYLVDDNSSLNSGDGTINFSLTDNARWALAQSTEPQKDADGKIVTDAQGNTQYQYYLALINEDDGTILKYVTFDRAKNGQDLPSYEQYLKLQGSPIATDPTANRYNASDVKPFYLTGLLSLANTVVYHLVIAHQHSLDYEDAKTKEIADTINAHLEEFLKYKNKDYLDYIELKTEGDIQYYDYKSDVTKEQKANLNNLLKTASLRDIFSFPIKDREVEGVGIGNRLNVPWYMRRQFCKYTLYQRDVLRSVTSNRPDWYKDADGNYTDANGNIVDEKDRVQRTFVENGEKKLAYEIDWVSVTQYDGDDPQKLADKETVQQENGKPITKLNNSHRNRRVVVDVVYEVDPEQFRFSDNGRNTTAWYSMMTNNKEDGLMNFSYKDGVGARLDRTYHYTNNYLWAPDGDPYGFVLRNRYATVNGTGWDNVVVTTKGHLPENATDTQKDGEDMYQATYTSQSSLEGLAKFVDERIVHFPKDTQRADGTEVTTDGAVNAIYEMFVGKTANAFLMHPTSAWVDTDKDNFKSYFMKHIITETHSKLVEEEANTILEDDDANWHLETTAEQLIPYFERAGYVGGLKPAEASKFENLSLYNTLQEYVKDKTLPRDYSVIDKARKLVYEGKFYQNNKGSKGDVVEDTVPHPETGLIFESDNLINMTQGYYRIKAFSEAALNEEEKNISNTGTGVRGIVGPRYVSGYRFLSEASDSPCNLYFIETTEENATIHTYGELKKKIEEAGGNSNDMFNHPAMRGNIEILPVEYDPSSIFYFEPSDDDPFSRYTFGTQDMEVHALAGGSEEVGKTELKSKESELDDNFSQQFRIDDIGGAAVTLRTLKDADPDKAWNKQVESNIQTNYLSIDANHRYRISCQSNNELEENDNNNDGLGIQDTKWLLQPVGTQTEWPYNQMPLRVEVQEAEKTSATEERCNYYGSLYVPFDTRLSSTVDNAFTVTSSPSLTDGVGTIRLGSVSQINEKGNGQFIPAAWPVVMKTNSPKTGVWMTWNETTEELEEDDTHKRYYVNLALPTTTPTTVAGMIGDGGKIQLKGKYLEQKLEGVGDGRKVMVFGLPFVEEGSNNNDKNQKGDEGERKSTDYYAYQDASTTDGTAKVGFYVNENWWREHGTDGKTENDGSAETSFLATARNATSKQRNNLYVYHNKVYYIYSGDTPAKPRIIAIFDGDEELDDEPQEPEEQDFTEQKETPWPCDVYDLAGRKVATHETPQTLRQNHPGLPKGVYIFGHMKVLVK